jgi:hypothetical protein
VPLLCGRLRRVVSVFFGIWDEFIPNSEKALYCVC